MKHLLTFCVILALILPANQALSTPIITPLIQVSKAVAKKVYSRFKHWFGASRTLVKPANFSDDIWLTFQNGGERFIKYAKNLKARTRGLTARAGKDVAAVLCNSKLSKVEKFKVLNGMKTKKYLADSGGIDSYKVMNSIERKFRRKEATEFMNDLIQQAACSRIRLVNQ
jgi:hypothetical protein